MDCSCYCSCILFNRNFWLQIEHRKARRFGFWNNYFLYFVTNGGYRFNYFWMVCLNRRIRRKYITLNFNYSYSSLFLGAMTFLSVMKKRHQQKLVILSLLLLLCFNMPFLLLFDSAASVGGIPVIYVYIFSLWIFSIAISLLVIKKYYE